MNHSYSTAEFQPFGLRFDIKSSSRLPPALDFAQGTPLHFRHIFTRTDQRKFYVKSV